MFREVLAEYVEWTPAALHQEIERLELESRERDARRLAVRAAAENTQTFAIDGHDRRRRTFARPPTSRQGLRSARCVGRGCVATSHRSVRR